MATVIYRMTSMAMTSEEPRRATSLISARIRRRAARLRTRLAWGRVAVLIYCIAFWLAAGFAVHALLG